jgi:polysaccharide biosynthesis transport protein
MLDNPPTQVIPNFVEEIDLQKYGLVLKRRWRLIALVAFSTILLSGLNALRQVRTYQASGQLLIRSDQTSQLTGIDGRSGEVKSLTAKTDPLTTEAEIIKSNRVLEIVATALKEKQSKGAVEPAPKEKEIQLYNKLNTKELLKGLSVKAVVGTDILQINYQSTSPEFSASVVNQVMEDYIRNNIDVNRSQAVNAKQFILAQLPETEAAVRKAENALRQFRETNGIVSLTQEAEESVRTISALNQNINSARSALAQSEAKVSALRAQVGMDTKTALTVNALNQSPTIQKSFADWRAAQAELAKQSTVYKDGTPEIQLLQDQEQAAKNALASQIQEVSGDGTIGIDTLQLSKTQQDLAGDLAKAEVDRATTNQGISSLMESRSATVRRSSAVPALETRQREFQRQVDAAQTTYKTLLTKLQDVQVAENQTIGNARIISTAEAPEKPNSASLTLLLLTGGIAGILLGIASAFAVDYLDKGIRTIKEVKKILPHTILGIIPTLFTDSDHGYPQLINPNHANFGAQEAYQMLQANLRFLPSDQSIKSIVITSAMDQEGKSTVAANLAIALAQGQRRVLLVDADLRTPSQHHVWDLNNVVGLSNLVVEQVQINAAIQTVTHNLHVLTAGSTPPNPLALLDSSVMKRLIEQFTDRYDFVIFDAPTLLGTADSSVLNRMTDGSLLVVRMGQSNAPRLKVAKQFLEQSSQRVLGMVINGATVHGSNGDHELDSYLYSRDNRKTTDKKLPDPLQLPSRSR